MAQKPITNRVEFGQNLNPLNEYAGVPAINDDGNLQTLIDKVDKVSKFWKTGKADGDLVTYLPNILPVTHQNLIAGIDPRQAYASETYTDKKSLDFTVKLALNTYTNYATMEIVLPIQFVKKTISIYDYANAQLKYLPKDSIKKLRKSFLYSNLAVYLDLDTDRRDNNATAAADRGDPNLTWRLNNLHDHTFLKNEYRIPLGLITDLGLCNFPVQADTRITITLERNLDKLFEDVKKRAEIPTTDPDASIEFWDRPYIDYQEMTLTSVWETYLKEILKDNNSVRMGVLPNPFQQTFEVATGAQTISVDFQGASRELNWLEISLVYDKSYAHETVYDSYELELAAHLIESVKFVNASKAYSLTGKLSYDINNKDEKYQMYKMFVAHICNGATFAPITYYKNNPIYQDMTDEYSYRDKEKDDRIYIDMRRSKGNTDELEKITRDDSGLVIYIKLKAAATKKMRLRVVGYSQGEYWYAYTNKGYIMAYKNYNIAKADKF